MIFISSPAKSLDFETAIPEEFITEKPRFPKEIAALASHLKQKSLPELQKLLGVSEKLAELNFERYKDFENEFSKENSRPALYFFKGDVFRQLELETYRAPELEYATKHIFVLSGLYGLLAANTLLQPYRLEMGTKITLNPETPTLYKFWDNKISMALVEAAEKTDSKVIVNLASNEYGDAVRKDALRTAEGMPISLLNITFKQTKNGKLKSFGILNKKARGQFLNYAIRSKIDSISGLKKFNVDGYSFNSELSSDTNLVFTK